MAELFGRRVRVTVSTGGGEGLAFDGLDVDFEVTRDTKPQPNKAAVRLYNLRSDRRQALDDAENVICKLEAGYENQLVQLLLAEMDAAITQRDGPDLITELSLEDGGKAYKRARTNRSFKPGTSLPQMMEKLSGDMDLGTADIAELASASFEAAGSALSGGSTLSGKASDELSKLTKSAGLEWSIQNRKLQVLARNQPFDATAVRLAPDTGLIGTPEVSSKGVLKAETLLIADIEPGRQVKVEGENVSGFFRVEKVTTRGDTRGTEWGHQIEAKPPGAGS